MKVVMKRVFVVSAFIAGLLVFTAQVVPLQAVPVQQCIQQGILINGQQAEGVTVIKNGQVQSFSCSAPLQQTEGVCDQPPAYYPVGNYSYSGAYPYSYYPYGYYPYSYWGGPVFSFGFGFGGHDHGGGGAHGGSGGHR
jgi:hypothetical protein